MFWLKVETTLLMKLLEMNWSRALAGSFNRTFKVFLARTLLTKLITKEWLGLKHLFFVKIAEHNTQMAGSMYFLQRVEYHR